MISVRAPHTGELLGEVPIGTVEDINEAVARGRDAFVSWATLGFEGRAKVMRKVRDHLVRHRADLIERLIRETGKVRGEALAETGIMLETFQYYLTQGAHALADREVIPRLLKIKRGRVAYHPRGVVGIISPWNFPLDLSFGEAIPALLAGNAVVVKPSEFTPLIAIEVRRLAIEAGLNPGLFQVVTGEGATGAALVDAVDQITFTGSVAVGRKVAAAAGARLIPCTLELGGKDPMIVLRDADLERASAGAVWGAFFNSGQMCMSVERVYVEESIAEPFVQAVVAKTKQMRQGVDTGYDMDVGSMTRLAQIELIEEHIADATARGAKILTGGKRSPSLGDAFFEPTVLVGVDHDMRVMREESFGPLLPIMRVRNADEAIQLANDSEFGLNASVWSKDLPMARRVARQVESGAVCINDVVISYALPELPFGGVKTSGVGRRHSLDGIRKYAVQQSIAEDRLGFPKDPHWYPYSATVLPLLEKAAGLFAGLKGLIRRG